MYSHTHLKQLGIPIDNWVATRPVQVQRVGTARYYSLQALVDTCVPEEDIEGLWLLAQKLYQEPADQLSVSELVMMIPEMTLDIPETTSDTKDFADTLLKLGSGALKNFEYKQQADTIITISFAEQVAEYCLQILEEHLTPEQAARAADRMNGYIIELLDRTSDP